MRYNATHGAKETRALFVGGDADNFKFRMRKRGGEARRWPGIDFSQRPISLARDEAGEYFRIVNEARCRLSRRFQNS